MTSFQDATVVSPLRQFRAAVLADPELQWELSRPYDPKDFVELAVARAADLGLALDAGALQAALHPAGISRWMPLSLDDAWPWDDWLPVHLDAAGEPHVDWAYFAGAALTEPFFENSAFQARCRPLNLAFHYRTSLDAFLAEAARRPRQTPRGLIFHMSRCGSTLVSQVLAAVARHTVVSEAPAIDTAVELERNPATSARCAGLLAALANAFGRPRRDGPRDLFLKLDAWHALALPRFRSAFPTTPWVFLYRDPIEVMVSQRRMAGLQAVPGGLPLNIVGEDLAGLPSDEYGACVLGRICSAAAEHSGLGGGLLVNYNELPDALWTRILPHFGVECSEDERAAMSEAALRDAKAPSDRFAPDGEAKRREATPRLIELCERHLADPYRRLEALRNAGRSSG
jgi:hypothetical protein